MKNNIILAVVMTTAVGSAGAQNIFNVQRPLPRQVQAGLQSPASSAVSVQSMSQYQPATPPAASSAPVISADPKVLAQFDRLPNESDDAFNARMKAVYQRASADMERATRAHIEKMRALSAGK